ncbi:hypothetical protein HNP46_006112 [Pseudomonas nitritireducens]|uniref:Uncharacterized protein n=1 Tax=Pseudomonas nitroreducens TaxID=46680 RepID=A0A7W7P3Z8_PSENT|nr:hypothetical protein [Pseudomonas nitritireducens]MBB4867201.1 hypothetical protein [Pseudomonas nitritireducens]
MSDGQGPAKPSIATIPAESAGLQSLLVDKERQGAEKMEEGRNLAPGAAAVIDQQATIDMEALFARYGVGHRRYVPAGKA